MQATMVVMVMVASPACPEQHGAHIALQDIEWGPVGVSSRQEHLRQDREGNRGRGEGEPSQ